MRDTIEIMIDDVELSVTFAYEPERRAWDYFDPSSFELLSVEPITKGAFLTLLNSFKYTSEIFSAIQEKVLQQVS